MPISKKIAAKKPAQGLSYKDAGVDIEQADRFVHHIKSSAKRTLRPEVLAGIGGFGAMFELPLDRFKKPVLVSSTDGVGTKLKIAIALDRHDDIGIDLVAMCVNDVITCGAEPLFFLDYFATGKLNDKQAQSIMNGIIKGCELSNATLIGGETAEMPGVYQPGEYDLAGFCVGAVEKSKIIDGSRVKVGDVILGIASSGVHSNGYSLVRKIIETQNISLDSKLEDRTLGEILLTPTKIYVKPILALCKKFNIHAIAHITGGGLLENIPRVLPVHTQAIINTSDWEWPPIFNWIKQHGNVAFEEMHRTFNLGVGMVVVLSPSDVEEAMTVLKAFGEKSFVIGAIESSQQSEARVVLT